MIIDPDRTWDLTKDKVFMNHEKIVYQIIGRVEKFKCRV